MHLISALFYSRTHFKQNVQELVNFPISISKGPKPVKLKSKLKTKIGLAEEGDITIRDIIIRISVFRTNYGINELHKEKSGSNDLEYRTLTERASLGEKYSRVSR